MEVLITLILIGLFIFLLPYIIGAAILVGGLFVATITVLWAFLNDVFKRP